LYQQALSLLTNAHARQEAGRRAYEVVKSGQGAVARTLAAVLEKLSKRSFSLFSSNPQPLTPNP
jgi:hypothetical protein